MKNLKLSANAFFLIFFLAVGVVINFGAATDIVFRQRTATNEQEEKKFVPATINTLLGIGSGGFPINIVIGSGLTFNATNNTLTSQGGSTPTALTGMTSITFAGGTILNETGSTPKLSSVGADIQLSSWGGAGLARLGLWGGNSSFAVSNATNTAYELLMYMDGINGVVHGRNGGLWISGDQGVVFKSTNIVYMNNTTQSTSKDLGSLVLEGGIGIEKDAFIGGNTSVGGFSNVTGNLNVTGNIFQNGLAMASMPANAQTGNYTLTAADNGKMIEHVSGTNATYTINMTVCNTDGFNFGVLNLSNTVIVTPSTGNIVLMQGNTTANNTSATLAAGSQTFFRYHSGGNWTVSSSAGVTVP